MFVTVSSVVLKEPRKRREEGRGVGPLLFLTVERRPEGIIQDDLWRRFSRAWSEGHSRMRYPKILV